MDEQTSTTGNVEIVKWRAGVRSVDVDALVAEEPLEIRVNDIPLAITMRTPGHDKALALGFLASEGIVRSYEDVFDVLRCLDADHPDLRNIVNVLVDPSRAELAADSGRQRYATSSCGLCGRATIESVLKGAIPLDGSFKISREVIVGLPNKLRKAQAVFERTGGLHGAGLFDLEGNLIHVAEDVGRHNAVDKVVGMALEQGPWPPGDCILMVSGRAGFEIVQKAAAVGIPAVCSVSAPSTLAVELAREMNIMLAGFLRGESINLYSCSNSVI